MSFPMGRSGGRKCFFPGQWARTEEWVTIPFPGLPWDSTDQILWHLGHAKEGRENKDISWDRLGLLPLVFCKTFKLFKVSGNYRIKFLQIFRAKHVSLNMLKFTRGKMNEPGDPFSLALGGGAQLCQGSCCGKRPGQFWLPPLGSTAEPAHAAPGAPGRVHLRKGREVPGSKEWGKSCEEQPWGQPGQRMRQGRRCCSRSWFHLSAVRRGTVSSQLNTGYITSLISLPINQKFTQTWWWLYATLHLPTINFCNYFISSSMLAFITLIN